MNYIKKKIKGSKKNKDVDDDDEFDPNFFGPRTSVPEGAPKGWVPYEDRLEEDSEEWEEFKKLTQRVNEIAQKAQENLETIREQTIISDREKPEIKVVKTQVEANESAILPESGPLTREDSFSNLRESSKARARAPAVPARPPPSGSIERELAKKSATAAPARPRPAAKPAKIGLSSVAPILNLEEDRSGEDDPFDTSFVDTVTQTGVLPPNKIKVGITLDDSLPLDSSDLLSDILSSPHTIPALVDEDKVNNNFDVSAALVDSVDSRPTEEDDPFVIKDLPGLRDCLRTFNGCEDNELATIESKSFIGSVEKEEDEMFGSGTQSRGKSPNPFLQELSSNNPFATTDTDDLYSAASSAINPFVDFTSATDGRFSTGETPAFDPFGDVGVKTADILDIFSAPLGSTVEQQGSVPTDPFGSPIASPAQAVPPDLLKRDSKGSIHSASTHSSARPSMGDIFNGVICEDDDIQDIPVTQADLERRESLKKVVAEGLAFFKGQEIRSTSPVPPDPFTSDAVDTAPAVTLDPFGWESHGVPTPEVVVQTSKAKPSRPPPPSVTAPKPSRPPPPVAMKSISPNPPFISTLTGASMDDTSAISVAVDKPTRPPPPSKPQPPQQDNLVDIFDSAPEAVPDLLGGAAFETQSSVLDLFESDLLPPPPIPPVSHEDEIFDPLELSTPVQRQDDCQKPPRSEEMLLRKKSFTRKESLTIVSEHTSMLDKNVDLLIQAVAKTEQEHLPSPVLIPPSPIPAEEDEALPTEQPVVCFSEEPPLTEVSVADEELEDAEPIPPVTTKLTMTLAVDASAIDAFGAPSPGDEAPIRTAMTPDPGSPSASAIHFDSAVKFDSDAFDAFETKFANASNLPAEKMTRDTLDPFGSAVDSTDCDGVEGGGDAWKPSEDDDGAHGFGGMDDFDPFFGLKEPPGAPRPSPAKFSAKETPAVLSAVDTDLFMDTSSASTPPSSAPIRRKAKKPKDDDEDTDSDDSGPDFSVFIRPKMREKDDTDTSIQLLPPPVLPPPPKSPIRSPSHSCDIMAALPPQDTADQMADDDFFAAFERPPAPAGEVLKEKPTDLPELQDTRKPERMDSQESPCTPLFEEDDTEPLDDFYTKYDGEGWELMLRQPNKKKLTGQRYWKKVFVKLSDNSVLQLFNKQEDKDPFQELPLQACYSLSEVTPQQFDQYGKIFTAKLQYVFYRERVGVRPGQISKVMQGQFMTFGQIAKLGPPLQHAPQISQLLKLGTQNYQDIKVFVREVEDCLFHLTVHRDRALTYKTEEIQISVQDELFADVTNTGTVLKQLARVRLFFLAFISGMPHVEIGLNDLRRQGKEVVGRHDIIPVVTEEWIRLEKVQFHSCIVPEEFDKTQILKLHPPDACFFEMMRFRVRPPKNRELPLQVRTSMSILGNRVEIRSDILVPGYTSRKRGQIPCEDVAIRFPLPECWIYLFRTEKHFRYGSKKSSARKPGKIKGLERFMGAAGQPQEPSLIEVSTGQAKYEHQHHAIVWRIPRLPKEGQGAYTTQLFVCHMDLTSYDQIPEELEKFVWVEFTMPWTTVSHTTVRSVSVVNPSPATPPEKFVRYVAKHEYRVEIEFKNSIAENEYLSVTSSSHPVEESVNGDASQSRATDSPDTD